MTKLLSREEAAELLGVSANTLAAWASNKRYPLNYIKVGRLAKYRMEDVNKFIDENCVGL